MVSPVHFGSSVVLAHTGYNACLLGKNLNQLLHITSSGLYYVVCLFLWRLLLKLPVLLYISVVSWSVVVVVVVVVTSGWASSDRRVTAGI